MFPGRLEVIAGSMYSGKTVELVRRLQRAMYARKRVVAFKHASDTRFHDACIGCHNGALFGAQPVATAKDLESKVGDYEVVGIDEAQFFGPELAPLCERLANAGKRVIVAGLDLDSMGNPFGPVPILLAQADEVTKLHAVCMVCGAEASRSHHKARKAHQVEIGAEMYEARCRHCWAEGLHD